MEDGEDVLPQMEAFKAFKKDIEDRYDEVAVHTQVRKLGSFSFEPPARSDVKR